MTDRPWPGPSTWPRRSGAAPRPTRGSAPWSSPPTGARSRAPPSRRAGRTPRSWPCEPPARPPGAPRSTATLEPCAHDGRTGPCADAIVDAGVARVVVAIEDPDPQRRGPGHRAAAGGRHRGERRGGGRPRSAAQLAPYLKHRRTGRPASCSSWRPSLDGRTAAPDGSSQWITGPRPAPTPTACGPRATRSLVGAGTVRADDPTLTVRDVERRRPPPGRARLGARGRQGPPRARARRARSTGVLDELGGRGVLQVLVEGGATVARDFHRAGLVDRYVLYLAPALFGGDDARPLFAGPGAAHHRRRVAGPHRRRRATTAARRRPPHRAGGAA